MYAYDVFLNKKNIDTIFYNKKEPVNEVYKSLVNHDGYDLAIIVKLRRQKRNSHAN